MKPKPSVLEIIDFAVTEMEFKIISPPPPYKANFIEFFKKYELDLDFDLYNEKFLRVSMFIQVNNVEKPLPGYKIKTKVVTLFRFEDTIKITAEEKKTIESFSVVYMALNNLRGIVSNFTATAPFGRYTIPSIDLNELIRQKQEKDVQTDMKERGNKKTAVKSQPDIQTQSTSRTTTKTKEMNKSD